MAVAPASLSARARSVAKPSTASSAGHKRAVQQLQARALAAALPGCAREISRAFLRLRDSMVHGDTSGLKANLPIQYSQPDYKEFEASLTKILTKQYVNVGNMSLAGVKQNLDITLTFDLNERIIPKGVIARQVTGVTDTVKRSINSTIRQGIDDGVHPSVTAKRLFEQASGWAGLDKPITESRAYTIARTESANAFNLGAILGYRGSGLVEKVEVLDGSECGWLTHNDPDHANGKIVTLDQAQAHPTAHPNCLRAFAPLVGTAAAAPPVETRTAEGFDRLIKNPDVAIADAVSQWVTVDPIPIQQAAAAGFTGEWGEAAAALAQEVANGTEAPTLFRGLNVQQDLALAEGQELNLNLASWSSKRSVAEGYASGLTQTGGRPVVMVLEKGATGLDMEAAAGDVLAELGIEAGEWITDGRFEVDSITSGPTIIVRLRQIEVFTGPSKFRGL